MNRQEMVLGFRDVDRSTSPEHFVLYLDLVGSIDSIRAYKQKTFTLLEIKEGDWILDVGCGAGEDALALAQIVGSTGKVVGVDNSVIMVAESQKRAKGTDNPVEYRWSDVNCLDFAEGAFDGCRADRVLQHLEDPHLALREIVRVARSGARIVVSEPDYETLIVDTGRPTLTRKILNFHCDQIRHGWIGRQLPGIFKGLGLTGVGVAAETFVFTQADLADRVVGIKSAAVKAYEMDAISAEEAAEWLGIIEEMSEADRFFCAITGFVVVGRKP
jgi:ubiquinone/menaquinone biosynthesis C-methylase UbiE